MATIAAQTIPDAGLTPTFTGVNASDTLTNDGNSFLEVKNASGGDITVTITAVTACTQGSLHNKGGTVVATTGHKRFGPFPINRFGRAPVVTYSATTSVTAALVTMIPA